MAATVRFGAAESTRAISNRRPERPALGVEESRSDTSRSVRWSSPDLERRVPRSCGKICAA
jgi:hypothetical protein